MLAQNRPHTPLVQIRLKGQEGWEREESLLFGCSYSYGLKNTVRTQMQTTHRRQDRGNKRRALIKQGWTVPNPKKPDKPKQKKTKWQQRGLKQSENNSKVPINEINKTQKTRNIPDTKRHWRRRGWETQGGIGGEDRRTRNKVTNTWGRTKTMHRHNYEEIRYRWSEAGKGRDEKDQKNTGTPLPLGIYSL